MWLHRYDSSEHPGHGGLDDSTHPPQVCYARSWKCPVCTCAPRLIAPRLGHLQQACAWLASSLWSSILVAFLVDDASSSASSASSSTCTVAPATGLHLLQTQSPTGSGYKCGTWHAWCHHPSHTPQQTSSLFSMHDESSHSFSLKPSPHFWHNSLSVPEHTAHTHVLKSASLGMTGLQHS